MHLRRGAGLPGPAAVGRARGVIPIQSYRAWFHTLKRDVVMTTRELMRPTSIGVVVESPEGRPPRLAMLVPCGFCGSVHRVPIDRKVRTIRVVNGSVAGSRVVGPAPPCDPTKIWIPKLDVSPAGMVAYAEASADLEKARIERRKKKRGGSGAGGKA